MNSQFAQGVPSLDGGVTSALPLYTLQSSPDFDNTAFYSAENGVPDSTKSQMPLRAGRSACSRRRMLAIVAPNQTIRGLPEENGRDISSFIFPVKGRVRATLGTSANVLMPVDSEDTATNREDKESSAASLDGRGGDAERRAAISGEERRGEGRGGEERTGEDRRGKSQLLHVSVAFCDNHMLYFRATPAELERSEGGIRAGDGAGIHRALQWLPEPSKRVTCMALGDSGEALCLITLDGSVYILDVITALRARHTVIFPHSFTSSGLPSLAAFARTKLAQTGAPQPEISRKLYAADSDVDCFSIPLFSQLRVVTVVNSQTESAQTAQPSAAAPGSSAVVAIGLDRQTVDAAFRNPADRPTVLTIGSVSAAGLIETATVVRWWRPARSVILEEIRSRRLGGHEPVVSKNRLRACCEDRYLLIGHASGRVTLVDTSASVRAVVWTVLLDAGMPIRSLNLFGELGGLRQAGSWSFDTAASWSADTESSEDYAAQRANASASASADKGLPDAIDIPECFVLVRSDSAYFRLVLERPISLQESSNQIAISPYTITLLDATSNSICALAEHKDYLALFPPGVAQQASNMATLFQNLAPTVVGGNDNAAALLLQAITQAGGTGLTNRSSIAALLDAASQLVAPDVVKAILGSKADKMVVEFLPIDTSSRVPTGRPLSLLRLHNAMEAATGNAALAGAAGKGGMKGFFSSIFSFGGPSEARTREEALAADVRRPAGPISAVNLVREGYMVAFPTRLYPQDFMPSKSSHKPWKNMMLTHLTTPHALVSLLHIAEDKFRTFDPSLGGGKLLPLLEMLLPTTSAMLSFVFTLNLYSSLLCKLKERGKHFFIDPTGTLRSKAKEGTPREERHVEPVRVTARGIIEAFEAVTVSYPPFLEGSPDQRQQRSFSDADAASVTSELTADTPEAPAPGIPRPILKAATNLSRMKLSDMVHKKSALTKRYGSAGRLSVSAGTSPKDGLPPASRRSALRNNALSRRPMRATTELTLVNAVMVVFTEKLIFIAENPRTISNKLVCVTDAPGESETGPTKPASPKEATPVSREAVATATSDDVPHRQAQNGTASAPSEPIFINDVEVVGDEFTPEVAIGGDSPMMTGRTARTAVKAIALPPAAQSSPRDDDDDDDDEMQFSDEEDLGTTAPNTLMLSYMDMRNAPSARLASVRNTPPNLASTSVPGLDPGAFEPTFSEVPGQFMKRAQLKHREPASGQPKRNRTVVGSYSATMGRSFKVPATLTEEPEDGDAIDIENGWSANAADNPLPAPVEEAHKRGPSSELSSLLAATPTVRDDGHAVATASPTEPINPTSTTKTMPSVSEPTSVATTRGREGSVIGDPANEEIRRPASVYVVSINLASRAFQRMELLDKLMSKLTRVEAVPAEHQQDWPEPEDLSLPTDAILQRFEFTPGEIILDMGTLPVLVTNSASVKRAPWLPSSVHIVTSSNFYSLSPDDVLEPSSIVRRKILDADVGSYSFSEVKPGAEPTLGSLSVGLAGMDEESLLALSFRAVEDSGGLVPTEATQPKILAPMATPLAAGLRAKVAVADRVSFALGLDSTRIYEEMADGACQAVIQLAASGALVDCHPIFQHHDAGVQLSKLTTADVRSAAALIVATGSLLDAVKSATGNAHLLLQYAVSNRKLEEVQPIAKSAYQQDVLPLDLMSSIYPTAGVHRWGLQDCSVATPPLAVFLSHPLVTALLLRAYALFTMSNAAPVKTIVMLTKAGRPDFAVAFAASALNFTYLYPCVARGVAPPLPPLSLRTNQLPPAERSRVANLLIQCQTMAWPARTRFCPASWENSVSPDSSHVQAGPILLDTHAYSYAMSPNDFARWLTTNEDYSWHRAIQVLVANGLMYEALIVGHRQDKGSSSTDDVSKSPAMHMVLAAAAAAGAAVLAEDPRCIKFLAERGYSALLLEKYDKFFLNAMSPSNLSRLILWTRPTQLKQILAVSVVPAFIEPQLQLLSKEGLLAWTQALQPVEPILVSADNTGMLNSMQAIALKNAEDALNCAIRDVIPLQTTKQRAFTATSSMTEDWPLSPLAKGISPRNAPQLSEYSLDDNSSSAEAPKSQLSSSDMHFDIADITEDNVRRLVEFFFHCLLALMPSQETSPHANPDREIEELRTTNDWNRKSALVERVTESHHYLRLCLRAYDGWYRPHVLLMRAIEEADFECAAIISEMHNDHIAAYHFRLHRQFTSAPREPLARWLSELWAAWTTFTTNSEVSSHAALMRHTMVALATEHPDVQYAVGQMLESEAGAQTSCATRGQLLVTLSEALLHPATMQTGQLTSFSREPLKDLNFPATLLQKCVGVHAAAQADTAVGAINDALDGIRSTFPLSADNDLHDHFENETTYMDAITMDLSECLALGSIDEVDVGLAADTLRISSSAVALSDNALNARKRDNLYCFSCGHAMFRSSIHDKWLPLIKRQLCPDVDVSGELFPYQQASEQAPARFSWGLSATNDGERSTPLAYVRIAEEYRSVTPMLPCPECLLRQLAMQPT